MFFFLKIKKVWLLESKVAKALFVLVKGFIGKFCWMCPVLTTSALCVNQDTFVTPLNKQTKLPGRAWLPASTGVARAGEAVSILCTWSLLAEPPFAVDLSKAEESSPNCCNPWYCIRKMHCGLLTLGVMLLNTLYLLSLPLEKMPGFLLVDII